jgi:hypothetical protein
MSIAEQWQASLAALAARIVRFGCLALGGSIVLAVLALAVTPFELPPITHYYLFAQDAPVLLATAAFVLLAHLFLRAKAVDLGPVQTWLSFRWAVPALWASIGIVCLTAYVGARLAHLGHALSLDEFMAEFDSRILAAGKLVAAVAPEWRDVVSALQPIFRLPVPDNAYWVSSYLPMNAALRAGFAWLGWPTLTGVALAAVSLLALFGIARRLWPDRSDAAIVSVVLLASSSQFLVTAPTPYAMTAHLALNLVWLWLFLRGTWPAHIMAVAVAFVACGLHQVVFHPLFAAPFLLSLVLTQRWRLAFFYGCAYGAIVLFWILYWSLLLGAAGTPVEPTADVGFGYFLQRVADMASLRPSNFILMGTNLLRFIAWQAPLMIPLALVGVLASRGRNVLSLQLACGIALTLGAMLVLMPFQGHGWGYRYLHGLLGSFALLGAQGWIWLTDRSAARVRNQLVPALLVSTALALLVLLPWRLVQARTFVGPYAAASAAIAGARQDVVVVDARNVWYGMDLVRNDPFLSASPKVLNLVSLKEQKLAEICSRFSVAIFDEEDAGRLGMQLAPSMPPHVASRARQLRESMRPRGCDARHVTDSEAPAH